MSIRTAALGVALYASLIVSVRCHDYCSSGGNAIPCVLQKKSRNTLLAALNKTGLIPVLEDLDITITVFAPTDAAFVAAGINLDSITTRAEIAKLNNTLLYHGYDGAEAIPSGAIPAGSYKFKMLNGDKVTVSKADGENFLRVNNVTIIDDEPGADNGFVYTIDQVLLPPSSGGSSSVGVIVGVLFAVVAVVAVAGGIYYKKRVSAKGSGEAGSLL